MRTLNITCLHKFLYRIAKKTTKILQEKQSKYLLLLNIKPNVGNVGNTEKIEH